jgi:hypothetical protein
MAAHEENEGSFVESPVLAYDSVEAVRLLRSFRRIDGAGAASR